MTITPNGVDVIGVSDFAQGVLFGILLCGGVVPLAPSRMARIARTGGVKAADRPTAESPSVTPPDKINSGGVGGAILNLTSLPQDRYGE
jgi:hypothetical protein